jgi:hypothetical protein
LLLRSAQNCPAVYEGAEIDDDDDDDDDDAGSRDGGQWRRRVDSGSSVGSDLPRGQSSLLPELHRPLLPPTRVGGGGGPASEGGRFGHLGHRAMSTPHGWAPSLGLHPATGNAESGLGSGVGSGGDGGDGGDGGVGRGLGSSGGRNGASRATPSADLLRFYNKPGTPTAGQPKESAPGFFSHHSNASGSGSTSSDEEGSYGTRQGLMAATRTVRVSLLLQCRYKYTEEKCR